MNKTPERNGFGIVSDGEVFLDAWVRQREFHGVGTAYYEPDWRKFVTDLDQFPVDTATLKLTRDKGGISVHIHPRDTSGHYYIDVDLKHEDGFTRASCRFNADYSDVQKLRQQFAALFEGRQPELTFYESPTR